VEILDGAVLSLQHQARPADEPGIVPAEDVATRQDITRPRRRSSVKPTPIQTLVRVNS
jgi:hypothetical protein